MQIHVVPVFAPARIHENTPGDSVANYSCIQSLFSCQGVPRDIKNCIAAGPLSESAQRERLSLGGQLWALWTQNPEGASKNPVLSAFLKALENTFSYRKTHLSALHSGVLRIMNCSLFLDEFLGFRMRGTLGEVSDTLKLLRHVL